MRNTRTTVATATTCSCSNCPLVAVVAWPWLQTEALGARSRWLESAVIVGGEGAAFVAATYYHVRCAGAEEVAFVNRRFECIEARGKEHLGVMA
jgi:hypothetical protein